MKKKFLLIIMIAASVFTSFADKTIYVASSAAGSGSGVDASNPTTFPQALGALDATGYTTIVLPNSAQFTLSGGTTGYGRLPIPDNSKIIIEGNNSTLQGDGGETRIIRASTGTNVTLRNLTLKAGNAAASIGGAIFFAGDSLKIANCIFDGNTSDNGAALGIRGKYVKITNSWFKNNILRNSFQGGAISHTGATAGGKLIIENTTFSNNNGKAANAAWGTAIITAFDGTTRNYLSEISITNCTFFQNNAGLNTTSGYAAVQLDYLGTTAPAGVATTATFVNNTFYGNSDAAIRFWGKQQAITMVNNVIIGDSYAKTSVTGVQDHGLVAEFTVAEGRPAIVAKNNYIVAKTPLSVKIDDAALQSGNSNNNTIVTISSQTDIDALGLSSSLQIPATGVPYLSISSSSSPLVEGGINSVSGVTIPTTDIRGVMRSNNINGGTGVKSDIGAYELDNLPIVVTGLENGINESFKLNQSSESIAISSKSNKELSVTVFLTTGQSIYTKKSNNIVLEKSSFPKGVLIIMVNDGVKSVAQKVII